MFWALALFFVVCWTLLFVILPLRNQWKRNPARIVPGQDPGAPALPRLRARGDPDHAPSSVVFLLAIQIFELTVL